MITHGSNRAIIQAVEVVHMVQPYRTLKYKADKITDAVDKLLAEREQANAEDPATARPLLWEEVIDYLGISVNYWDKYRDFNDPLQSPDEFKEYNPTATDKDYKIYVRHYKDRLDLQEAIKKAEVKLSIGVISAGLVNPRISTYCIWLSKQKHYGGYTDRQDAAPGDVKISIKLLDDKGRSI